MDNVRKILIISSDSHLKDILNFCFDGWGYEVFLHQISQDQNQTADLEQIKKVSPDVIVVDIESARSGQLDTCSRLKNDFSTAFIPVITLINKRHLRNQLLQIKQGVDDYLIKPPDPLDLRMRIEMALRRQHHCINANTLTGLPGVRILEDLINEKFQKNVTFSFCYLDIDNFKSFNDLHGYQKGDKVLIQAAHLLQQAIAKYGNKDDFVSHIGGDDFAFITTPDKYAQVCSYYVRLFDNIIPFHYRQEDRKSGFVVVSDRNRKIKQIPLMSVSIAVVNKGAESSVKNLIELNERISELKRFLKKTAKSSFMADRRDTRISNNDSIQVNKKRSSNLYQPLGQILINKQFITSQQLYQALSIHWKKGVAVGEVLKELGFLDDQKLNEALSLQKVNFSSFSQEAWENAA